MPRLTEAQRRFLDNPFCGVVTTIRPDGTPHNTVVWVEQADGEVFFNTATGRAKARHLERNPAVALTVVDPNDAYRWLSVSGPAEVTREGVAADTGGGVQGRRIDVWIKSCAAAAAFGRTVTITFH